VSTPKSTQSIASTRSYASYSTTLSRVKVSKEKGKGKGKDKWPLFEKLAQYTTDEYWHNLLLNCALGKFPRSIFYNGESLSYRRAKVNKSILLEQDGIEDYTRLITFFRGVGFSSGLDNQVNQERIEERQKDRQERCFNSWKEVKLPTLKEQFIQNYSTDLAERLNLTTKEYRHLLATLALASLFKKITTETVQMKEGKIEQITCIEVIGEQRGTRTFELIGLEEETGSSSLAEEALTPDQGKLYLEAWRKYLEDLERKQAFYQSLD